MKIGFDLRSLQTSSQYRGIGYYTYSLVKTICEIAPQNDYIFFANNWNCISNFPLLNSLLKETGKRIVKLPITRRNNYSWERKWEKLSTPLFFQLENLDILHITSLFETEVAISLSPKKEKVIVTMYDLIPLIFKEQYLDKMPSADQTTYQNAIESVRNYTDGVIAISNCTKNDVIERLNYPNNKIEVVHGGARTHFCIENDKNRLQETRKKFGISSDYIICTAAEDYRKNIKSLVKAFSIFNKRYNNKFYLVIVGRSSKHWQDQIKKLWKIKGNMIEKVIFTQFITNDELRNLYNDASLFVFPSLYEGLGLPVLEAMACGVPVIASNTSSIPEIAGDEAILFDPNDELGIAQKMDQVLSDNDLQDRLRINGSKVVREFTWKRAAEKTLGFYEMVKKQ